MSSGEIAEGWEFASTRRLLPEAVVSAVGYRSALAEPALHRGVPSPALTFVVTFDEPVVSAFTPEQALGPGAASDAIIFGGLHTRPAFIVQPRVQSGVQLSVRPLAARALFGLPAAELRGQVVSGDALLGPAVDRLRERMIEAPTWEERFALVAGHLRDRLADATARHAPRPEVAAAWKWIAWHRGTGSMAELARHVHLSERQLSSVFRGEIGLSPKAVSRLMRFENARQHIANAVRSDAPLEISDTAHACGYYDHSHLVRDFQQYVGVSPSAWLAEERRNIQAGSAQANEDFSYERRS